MKIVKEVIWVASGQVVSALAVLAGIRIITGIVAPEIYGEYSLWIGSVLLLYNAFCWPTLQAILRLYPDVQKHGKIPSLLALARKKLLRINAAFVTTILLGGIVYSFVTGFGFEKFLCVCALIGVESMKGFGMTVLSATRQQKSFAIQMGLDVVLRQACAVAAVMLLGESVGLLLAGMLCGAALAVTVLWARLRKSIEIADGNSDDANLKDEMRSFSRPLTPLAISGWVSGLSDRYIIASLAGTDAAGIYSATYGLISRPFLMIGTTTELALRQIFYQAVSAEDERKERIIMKAWLAISISAGTLGTLAVWAWGEHIGNLLLGESFRGGIKFAPWIAAGYCLLLVSQALERNAYAHKNTRGVLKIQLGGALASILCVVPATAAMGMPGAAYVAPVYFGIQALIAYLIARPHLKRRTRA